MNYIMFNVYYIIGISLRSKRCKIENQQIAGGFLGLRFAYKIPNPIKNI